MIQFIRKLLKCQDKEKSSSHFVSFNTDDTYIKALNDLAEKTNRSKAEVLRDSLNLYIKAVDEWDQGRGITFEPMEEGRPSKQALVFEATQDFIDWLDDLAKENKVGRAEVVRRSLGLYAWAAEEADKGNVLRPVPWEQSTIEVQEENQ